MSIESIESIASQPSTAAPAATCASCGAPLAADQRYCLQCGEPAVPMSSLLLAGTPRGAGAAFGEPSPAAGVAPPTAQLPPAMGPPAPPGRSDDLSRNNAVTVIAGVGVLLLAMGIGVLIGRSTSSKPSAVPPQVITVGSAPAGGTTPGASESFTDDWPAGTNGYAIQLQTLPVAGTQVSAVQSAKSSAEGKGAQAVGALKSEDFSSLPAGNYVIYSGDYKKQAEAQKALSGLGKSFPGASVIHVSGGTGGAGSAGSGGKGSKSSSPSGGGSGGASGGGSGKPSPESSKVLEELHKSKGKSYEEKSKNLPDVVGT
ncbi:MAG TPA: zinc ribbon domain-containing protein [Solirubrobacteraceae bacterium]|nr:zinc ribbon domain-containing protein [Solirubrobacteraceae bacterium]